MPYIQHSYSGIESANLQYLGAVNADVSHGNTIFRTVSLTVTVQFTRAGTSGGRNAQLLVIAVPGATGGVALSNASVTAPLSVTSQVISPSSLQTVDSRMYSFDVNGASDTFTIALGMLTDGTNGATGTYTDIRSGRLDLALIGTLNMSWNVTTTVTTEPVTG